VTLIMGSYVPCVSVSKRLDQLLAEPFVADLGYPADASMVARVVSGLELLADAIDSIHARVNPPSSRIPAICEPAGRPPAGPSSEPGIQPEQSAKAASGTPQEQVGHGSPISLE
jgi:hypothetical protein